MDGEAITARLREAFRGCTLEWARDPAQSRPGFDLACLTNTEVAADPTRAILRLSPRTHGPHACDTADVCAPWDAPTVALSRAGRLAVRYAVARREAAARLDAVRNAALPFRTPTLSAPGGVLYLGAPQPALLALQAGLARHDIAFYAAVTPVSALDRLHRGDIDALVVDAGPGQARALSILTAIQRNARTASLPVYIISPTVNPEFEATASGRGARGIWSGVEAREDAFADWVTAGLRQANRHHRARAFLEALADASLAQGVRAERFHRRHITMALAYHRHVSVIALPLRSNADLRVRPNEAVLLARRILRVSDAVRWRAPGVLMVVTPETPAFNAARIATRLSATLPQAGMSAGDPLVVTSVPEETGEAFGLRLERLFTVRLGA